MAEPETKTVSQIMTARQKEILGAWLANIKALPESRTLELMTAEQLTKQTKELLALLVKSFESEIYDDIEQPEFADSVAMLRDISATRAEQRFTPSETAVYIMSLKDALLTYLQEDLADEPELLHSEVIKMNKVIDTLALVTFETFAKTREALVLQQSKSMLELSTPTIKLWDEIVLLPLIGVVDTQRAQLIIENLLQSIIKFEARVAIIDVTGVPMIDTQVAQHLFKTISAAQMMGTETIVTGISADTAQTMTKLEIDLSIFQTKGSLLAGIAEALAMVDRQITSLK